MLSSRSKRAPPGRALLHRCLWYRRRVGLYASGSLRLPSFQRGVSVLKSNEVSISMERSPFYDLPRRDARLGDLSPSPDDVASALAGRDGARLQASGAHAANLLGLSDQVPVRLTFLTDGRSRRVQLGRQQIILKHTTPRQMATAGRISGTVIQALRWLGQDHVDDRVVATLRRRLSDTDKRQLRQDLRYAPTWVADVIRKVLAPRDVPHRMT